MSTKDREAGKPRRALGRGLDALLPVPAAAPAPPEPGKSLLTVPIEEIAPQRGQPRRRFDDASIDLLAASIREHGILEPLLVRKSAGPEGQPYELVAGERRWRAAQKAGIHEVPVLVRDATPVEAFELALVENLQREDLNAVEISQGYRRLIEDHGYTQETLASRVGKDRSTITNSLRLLKLPALVLELIAMGKLSEGHGRALLGAPTDAAMTKLAHAAVEGDWSVRECERRARAAAKAKEPATETEKKSANVRDLEARLSRSLGSKVRVADKQGRGKITIPFVSYDQLDEILEKILE
ncbi:MAG: ParB/RepB/Spo0J family partition protein [Deltaproteobacteria bacterium]|nr:ParB/RepB/Spo0J family partition protein [Deltaproteobacteria bacterium]